VLAGGDGDTALVDVLLEGGGPVAEVEAVENPVRSAAEHGSDAVDALGVKFDQVGELARFFDWG
jgi:hypothetical protein